MNYKPARLMSLEDLEKLSTKQLLARIESLRQCEESAAFSDRDIISGAIQYKDTPEWKAAHEQLKAVLSLREHVPKGAELAKKRRERAILNRTAERKPGKRKL